MSALRVLVAGAPVGAKDDEADGPKHDDLGAAYMRRMFEHMQKGDFSAAFECLGKAQALAQDAEEENEGDGEEPTDEKGY